MKPVFELEIPKVVTFFFPAYMTFTCIGLFCAMLLVYFRIVRIPKINFKRYLILVGSIGIGIVVGSKFLFILTQIPEMIEQPTISNILYIIITSGFVFYGGLLGSLLGVYIYARKMAISYRDISNVIAPSFPLFHMWGRIGCAFGGCCYGVESDWGIILENEPNVKHLPVQFFESAILFFIFIMLLIVERKINNISLMQLYLGIYAVSRFVLEFYRGDEIRGVWLGVSTSQWVSLGILAVLIVLNLKKRSLVIEKNETYL